MYNIAISVLGNIYKNDGTTIRAKRVADVLKNEYNVFLITRTDKKSQINNNISIQSVNPEYTKLWNLKLITMILNNKFDFIYCSNDWFGFMTFFIFSLFYKYKIIFEAHAILSEERIDNNENKIKIGILKILEKFVASHSDYFIALSKNTFDFYKEYNKKIKLIHVFIDEKKFKKNDFNKENCGNKKVGLIGPFNNIINSQSLDFIYENLENFDDRIEFRIIGACDKIVKNERISFSGYIKDLDNYVKEISSLDAVIIPSTRMTSGPLNKIIEPMACSVPVFTTPIGAIGLYEVKNKSDILVFDEINLVENVNKILFDDKMLEKISLNARKTVEKHYSQTSNAKLIIDVIQEMGDIN